MKVSVKPSGESGRGHEVCVEVEAVSPFGGTYTSEKRMLVPETRRFVKALQDAILEAERINRPKPPKLGNY